MGVTWVLGMDMVNERKVIHPIRYICASPSAINIVRDRLEQNAFVALHSAFCNSIDAQQNSGCINPIATHRHLIRLLLFRYDCT